MTISCWLCGLIGVMVGGLLTILCLGGITWWWARADTKCYEDGMKMLGER